jgi:hypothetical protein
MQHPLGGDVAGCSDHAGASTPFLAKHILLRRLPGHHPQDALDGAAGLSQGKGFRETRRATRLQEGLRGGLQGIARQKDAALTEVWLLALQKPVKTRAVELRHAHVAQDQVIGARGELGQGQAPVLHRVHGVAIAAQQPRQPAGQVRLVLDTRIVWPRTTGASSALGGAGVDTGTAPTGRVRRNVAPWPVSFR